MREEMREMGQQMSQMRYDYDYANERFTSLKEKYDSLQAQYNKDKNFYEEALEARMN